LEESENFSRRSHPCFPDLELRARRSVPSLPVVVTLINRIGRTAAIAAILFGSVLTASGITRYDDMVAVLWIVGAGLLSLAGGVAFLAGLDFGRGRGYRVVGWVAFTLGFLLPTSLIFLLVPLSLLALPAALRND